VPEVCQQKSDDPAFRIQFRRSGWIEQIVHAAIRRKRRLLWRRLRLPLSWLSMNVGFALFILIFCLVLFVAAQQVRSSQKVPPSVGKNFKLLLTGVSVGILMLFFQTAFAPAPKSVFSSQDSPSDSSWFTSLLKIDYLIFSPPFQVLYTVIFASFLVWRPRHRNSWIIALILGYAIPTIAFQCIHWIVTRL
jgi:hypothetical protein